MRRGSGILCHITSLSSSYGIGDMGPAAYRFVDFLAETKQSYWQILPLNPTDPTFDNSPYHSISAFACNPLLISPELMVRDGWLTEQDVESVPDFPSGHIDYDAVIAFKEKLFQLAYRRLGESKGHPDYEEFCSDNARWLNDFALFVALNGHFNGAVWSSWPDEVRDRKPEILNSLSRKLHDAIERGKFLQYLFHGQWTALKRYCNDRGVQIIGDMPIYVDYDSVDLWVNPDVFKLDDEKKPYAVAGVPPDYFSATGQLWGNPVYRWDILKERRYEWWVQRVRQNLRLFDFLRVDHFRGLVAYWEVPATEDTAINGKWIEAPAEDFLNELAKRFPLLPIIAEDLGVITPDVREVIQRFELPGMKILLFAFGDDLASNPYVPHNLVRNCLVYTGTHDNNTVRGWFEKEATLEEKKRVSEYLGRNVSVENAHWEFIRLAMMSVANASIVPIQDVLGLGEEARMNRPATMGGNWGWRLLPEQLTSSVTKKLARMTEMYGRA